MAQLGRVTTSLVSGVAEATLALANLNFDFSLVKVNAPIEFEGVGKTLSTLRRSVAESGSTHVTARKLGAIFETIVPQTPKLYEAYGSRASEICQYYEENGRVVVERGGLFADFSGPDATSIWAAATSGKVAIAVHLLACLLARFWKPAEAISIWEEIISVRKKSLEDSADNETFQMATVLASQVSLTREQLAEWDNSARAWLRFADRAHDEQQTKLKLVIDEIQQPIATRPTLYESVIDAWTVALLGMEELLKGASQGVSHSGVVLALSSWHLYPNLSIEGGAPVFQNDALFPRGTTLFLNLQGNPNTNKRGVYWSLSLSHMRFYGAPVQTERSYATDSSRISFTQFLHAVLGSTSSQWATRSSSPLEAARLVKAMTDRFEKGGPAWLKMLAVAAVDMLDSTDSTRLLNLKLYRVGQERGASMLTDPKRHPLPVFGLADPSVFLKCLKSPNYKLKILRKYAERFFPTAKPHEIILKVDVPPSWYAQFPTTTGEDFDDHSEFWMERTPAFQVALATKLPDDSPDTEWELEDAVDVKKSSDVSSTNDTDSEDAKEDTASSSAAGKTEETQEPNTRSTEKSLFIGSEDQMSTASLKPLFIPPPIFVSMPEDGPGADSDADQDASKKPDTSIEYFTALPLEIPFLDQPQSYLHWSYRKPQPEGCLRLGDRHHFNLRASDWILPAGIESGIGVSLSLLQALNCSVQLAADGAKLDAWLQRKFFLGDAEAGGMFVRGDLAAEFEAAASGPRWGRKRNMKREIDIADIEDALNADELDLSKWVSDIQNDPVKREAPYYQSLTALASAWRLYEGLQPATVDPAVLGRCVTDAAWGKSVKFGSVTHPLTRELTRGQAFACIAEFETGGIDLAASEFESVMAISIAESIFAARPLLSDPSELPRPSEIIRLDGNVGKSGLVLMVPPAEPMISNPDPDSWRVIEREEYKGQPEDCFAKTSLHLSFTDWSVPVSTGAAGRGRRSAEASLAETLVSVFDRGRWIGDLDVLAALRRGYAQPDHEFFYCHTCPHDMDKSSEEELFPDGIVAIRSWDEFLDRPNSPAVVVAHANWEARLAATVMGVARGDRVFFCRGRICQECLQNLETFGGTELVNRALFIA